jgi:hypothetical protein
MATITATKLKNTYGSHSSFVLADYLQSLPRAKREHQRFTVVQELPTVAEFEALKIRKFTTTVDSLICDAYGEFETLRDELQEWYDNLPEAFQSGDKGDQLQTCIDELEVEQPSPEPWIENLMAFYLPHEKITSRQDRCNEAIDMLNVVFETLNTKFDDESCTETQKEELQEIIDGIDACIATVECVEFPSMMG